MATHSCSCLENPRDRGASWAAIYGVAQSWTWLKRLSSSSNNPLPTKVHLVKAMVFPVVMYRCENWLWSKLSAKELMLFVVLEKTLESPLDCKEIQPVHPKGDQSWVFIGRSDAEAETPVLWPPHVKSWLIGKDPDAGKDCRQEEKGTIEAEMAGWHHLLDGREFEWTPGVGDGQGGLACCDSWGRRELDMTERLNWIELKNPFWHIFFFSPFHLAKLYSFIRLQFRCHIIERNPSLPNLVYHLWFVLLWSLCSSMTMNCTYFTELQFPFNYLIPTLKSKLSESKNCVHYIHYCISST